MDNCSGPELLLTQNPEPDGVGLLVPLQVAADAGVVARLVPPHSLHQHIFIIIKIIIVKLKQGSGKDRQGMALKAKGLKA